MDLVSFSFFFFSFHLLVVGANSACNQSFPCGNFDLEFPFTNISNPGCGFIVANGCDSGTPYFYSGGYHYSILEKITPNKFLVQDTQLRDSLNARNCTSFRNLSMPHEFNPLSLTFTFSQNITLFTCFTGTPDEQIQDYFRDYRNLNCQDSSNTVYYQASLEADTPQRGTTIPTECKTVQLPLQQPLGDSDDDLFTRLTPNFTLEWSVLEDCFRISNNSNEFDCREKGNNTKMILAITLPIAAIVIVLVTGYILWQRKKKTGGMAAALTSTLMILFFFIWRKRAKARQKYEADIELFLKKNGNLAPMRYRYSSIKKMTNSFSVNLGKGGYGSVYKGKFTDGHLVAVKLLNESNGNGEEFMNEVASISRTSHINIVSLLGFCSEGPKRALIYDFMPNGSLEKFIGSTASAPAESELGWDKLFEIALGIARGLEYLHQGCNMRILHLDIKPQNILLDKDFNPRISDFGLAKLCPNRSSIVSMMVARGTIGYIAPEVFSRNFGDISYKSDVYSYGMLVLEMVGGRKNIDPRDVDHTSEIYFPHYIYKQLEMDAERDLVGTVVEDEFHLLKKNLTIVGLWCIQTNPKDRPSMTKVVEMLKGKHGTLEVPPKPYLYSPPRLPPISLSTSDSM